MDMQGMGMMLYMLLFGFISGGIWVWMHRAHIGSNSGIYGIKAVLFFFAGIYFAVSVIKLYLGEAENTLIESFWDIEGQTYLHYGIIFIVISAVGPFLMKRLFPSHSYQIVQIFDSVFIILILMDLLLFGRIDNKTYCALYGISILAALGAAFLYRKQIAYIDREDGKKCFLEALPFVSVWGVMTGIYQPIELFVNNLDEFAGNFTAFLLILLAGSIAEIFLLDLIFILFLPKKIYKRAYLLIAGISCAGYVQSMFLNSTLAAMNGEVQQWSAHKLFVNTGIWFVILVMAAVGGYHKAAVRKVCQIVCVYISLIQIVTSGWLILTSEIKNENENAAITNRCSLELAQENNVLVFVLDNFDSSWFEAIYQEDNSILEPLADFTYYRNAVSQFAHTGDGITSLLTGVAWSADVDNYFEYAYKKSNAFAYLAEQGTDIEIFTDLGLLPEQLYQNMDNYAEDIDKKYKFGTTFITMQKTSMYKTAPFIMKNLYEYYTSDIKDMTYNGDVWSIDNDLYFYQNIVEKGLYISESSKNAFRFYHMRGAHEPFYLTDDLKYEPTGRMSSLHAQGKGSLKIVYAYMEQMKTLGKYEDATIIITADHGIGKIVNSEKKSGTPDMTSRPLFLIKRSGEQHTDMQINEAPVSQAELVPTILDAFGMDHTPYGRTFEEVPPDEQRIRTHVDDYYDRTIVYTIDGHAAELDNWKIERAVYY